MFKHVLFCLTIITLFASTLSFAGIIHVPSDTTSIQGGIHLAGAGDTVLVADSLYYENINFKGKAITVASQFLMDGDKNHINNTIIDGSQASHPDSGSVVYFISGEDTSSILCGFTVTGGTGTQGVGISPYSTGGGICVDNSGCRIRNNIIEFNYNITTTPGTYSFGGGIDVYTRSGNFYLIIEDNLIQENQVESTMDAHGGGINIWWYIDTPTRILNNIIQNNVCTSHQGFAVGGGVCYESEENNPKSTEFIGNIVSGNHAIGHSLSVSGGFGGGMLIYYTQAKVLNNTIRDNSVTAASGQNCYGAGLKISGGPPCEVKNNLIINNFFENGNCFGGGIDLWNNSAELSNNIICFNHAQYGGGMRIYSSADERMVGSEFTEGKYSVNRGHRDRRNKASLKKNNNYLRSIKVYNLLQAQPKLINNTIYGDTADYQGGGIYTDNSNVIIMNTILWGDSSTSGHSEIYQDGGTIDVVYSDIQGGWPGQGNRDVEPQFVPNDSLFHLVDVDTACINWGIDSLLIGTNMYYCPPYDFEGDQRPFPGTLPDIGSDETDVISGMKSLFRAMIPVNHKLHQNYPNPFNPVTTIEFDLPKTADVTLKVFNIIGEEIITLLSASLLSGSHSVEWDASNLASGVYLYRLQAGDYIETRKMVLMR